MSTYEKIENLTKLSPALHNALKAIESTWLPDRPPDTLAFGHLGTILAKEINRISRAELRSIFAFVEQLMKCEDENTRTAVASGFLESLLGESSAGRFDFRQVNDVLGEKSREYCHAWDEFCGIKTQGLD